VLDFWNRQVSNELFNIGDVRMLDMSRSHALVQVVAPFKKFIYPITLAFLQFTFMGLAFFVMYLSVAEHGLISQLRAMSFLTDRRWPGLVVSHVFSTFWLQALMMPAQVMSLGFFAATRAFEIPAAALIRPPVMGHRYGRKTLRTTGFAFGASCLLYFSYAQLAGCVCILSGNGVALSGLAFFLVYGMILAMPAANAVCQEALLTQPGTHPLLVLALQNIFASVLFLPILLISHFAGWEDIGQGFRMIFSYQEVFMLVMWMCAQVSLTSVVCIVLIQVVDSFWAIALRPIRVVFWGLLTLANFYLSSGMTLSIACPRSSFWSFMILCGCGLAVAAIYIDRKNDRSMNKASGGPLPSSAKPINRALA
jgi:hypothetical protein